MPTVWYPAQFLRSKQISASTRQFFFKIEAFEEVHYQAGQFFTFDLPTGDKRAQRWRSYSMSNRCNGDNIIECSISYKAGGLASEYFFSQIKEGDQIRIKGPEGNFILPENENQSLFFIGTGTGMAPYRAMIQDIIQRNLHFHKIYWIFGSRLKEDILYEKEWQSWMEQLPNLSIDICLSREENLPPNKENISYMRSYVHEAFMGRLEFMTKDEIEKCMFYLCGWSAMIDEAVANLITKVKVERQQIKFELYG